MAEYDDIETKKNVLDPTEGRDDTLNELLASPLLPHPKQSLIDIAIALSENKPQTAVIILVRLERVACDRGTPEQRLVSCIVPPLTWLADPALSPPEPYDREEQVASFQTLFDVLPCFRLGFMAANLAVLQAMWESKSDKVHVVDFEVGHGKQYVHLLKTLVAAKMMKREGVEPKALSITTFSDRESDERLRRVGLGLKSLAVEMGFSLDFRIMTGSTLSDLTRDGLGVRPDEALVVNFAYKLCELPDENVRDCLLKRVKGLSPVAVTVVEQELNTNTAPLVARVRDARDYYDGVFECLDAVLSRDSAERARVEAGLARRMWNSIACEGRDRVVRCEVFGKWRTRLGMAGFRIRPMGASMGEFLMGKFNSGTRGDGDPGFTVGYQDGGVCFGWKGKTWTVASTWQ